MRVDREERHGDRLAPLMADLPAGVFGDGFDEISARLDHFVDALAAEVAAALGLGEGAYPAVAELLARRGWDEGGRWAVEWLFETMALFGRAERNGDGWRVAAPCAVRGSAALREEACAAVPGTAPAYDVLVLAAEGLPSVLDGTRRGEEILFGPSTLGLWFDYFSNSNPHYAVSNTLVAVAASRALPEGAAVLEVGGGGGSGAEAVLGALAAAGRPPRSYLFTELQPAFLRRGTRVARAAAPEACDVASRRFDIDEPADALEVPEGSLDAVVAVNTMHLAADVAGALRRLASLVAPGGAVILGELVRPAGSGAVHVELPFTLLESFRRTPLDARIRPRPGFLTLEGWREAFRDAGLRGPEVLPAELARCQEVYAGFYGAALVATV